MRWARPGQRDLPSHGFGAGTLSCSTRCTVKTAACTECVPGVAAVTSCGHPIDPGNFHWPTTPSLAGSDGAVALAWTHFLSELRYTLSLAVIEPTDDEPTVIGLEGFDDDTPPPLLRSNMGTAVAPLGAGGWLVATAGEPEVVARAVSADGAVLSRTTLDTIAADTFDWPRADIVVAPRAAGPLVVWSRKTWIRAAVIAADGRSATPTFALPLDGRSITSTPTAVFTGGAFYVGYTTSGIQEQSLRLVRVASDGTVTKLADLEPTEHTKYPYLAAGTDDLRLSYVGPPPGALAPSVLWRRVSLNGATLAGPTVVGTAPGWNGPSPVAAAGGDTMVLVGGREGHTLGLARVALDGTISQPAAVIAKSPYELQPHGLVRRGAELVATWSATRINDLDGAPRIGLARITP